MTSASGLSCVDNTILKQICVLMPQPSGPGFTEEVPQDVTFIKSHQLDMDDARLQVLQSHEHNEHFEKAMGEKKEGKVKAQTKTGGDTSRERDRLSLTRTRCYYQKREKHSEA